LQQHVTVISTVYFHTQLYEKQLNSAEFETPTDTMMVFLNVNSQDMLQNTVTDLSYGYRFNSSILWHPFWMQLRKEYQNWFAFATVIIK